ncbi:MAG TPA: hypothetical protein DCS93_12130 [Microscillaceae bacterium]|nr:hypothetical protein [Microscillaceae bacterium]
MNTELEAYTNELWHIYPRVKQGAPTEKFWRKYARAIEFSRTQTSSKKIIIQKPVIPDIAVAYRQLNQRTYTFFSKEGLPFSKYASIMVQCLYYSFFVTGFAHVGLGLDNYQFWLHLVIWLGLVLVLAQIEKENEEFILKLDVKLLPDAFLLNNTSKIYYKDILRIKLTKRKLQMITCLPNNQSLKKMHEFTLFNDKLGRYGRSDLGELTNFLRLVIQTNALKQHFKK